MKKSEKNEIKSALSSVEKVLLEKIAEVLRSHMGPPTDAAKSLEEIISLQEVSFHLLAQQLALFTVRQRTPEARYAYVKYSLDKLVSLISTYEKDIKRAPRGKTV